jgi:hypothetical protein
MPRIYKILVTNTLPGVSSRFETGEFTYQAILREPIGSGNLHLSSYCTRGEAFPLFSKSQH